MFFEARMSYNLPHCLGGSFLLKFKREMMYSGNDCGENYHFEGSQFEQKRKKQ